MPKDQAKTEESTLVELQTLFPIGGRVTVTEPFDPKAPDKDRQKITIRVRALTMRQIKDMLGEALTIARHVQEGRPKAELVNEHFEEVLKLAAAAMDRDEQWLQDLDGGDFVRVTIAFIGANHDFFVQLNDLLYGTAGTQISRVLHGGGQTASPSSQATE